MQKGDGGDSALRQPEPGRPNWTDGQAARCRHLFSSTPHPFLLPPPRFRVHPSPSSALLSPSSPCGAHQNRPPGQQAAAPTPRRSHMPPSEQCSVTAPTDPPRQGWMRRSTRWRPSGALPPQPGAAGGRPPTPSHSTTLSLIPSHSLSLHHTLSHSITLSLTPSHSLSLHHTLSHSITLSHCIIHALRCPQSDGHGQLAGQAWWRSRRPSSQWRPAYSSPVLGLPPRRGCRLSTPAGTSRRQMGSGAVTTREAAITSRLACSLVD